MRRAGEARDRGVPLRTAKERNEAGADAEAIECKRIYEIKHLGIARHPTSFSRFRPIPY